MKKKMNKEDRIEFDDMGTFKKDGKRYGYFEVNNKRFEYRVGARSKKMRALKKATRELNKK